MKYLKRGIKLFMLPFFVLYYPLYETRQMQRYLMASSSERNKFSPNSVQITTLLPGRGQSIHLCMNTVN